MPPKGARRPLAVADSNIPAKTTAPGAEKAKPKPATKRKAAEIEEPQEVPEIDDDDPRLRFVDDNCNQVRSKINNFINSGAMKVGEFQKTLGVSSQAYSRFMGQTGPEKGMGCDTYYEAWKFFKKRQLQGIKLPKKKVKKEDEEKKLDVSGIHLDGESDGEVEVYETCDSMRTKMRALLREPGISQAGFLRAASGCLPDNKKVSSAALTAFLGKKGPSAGNTSCAFYASYCLFEKMRIRDNKPKSEFRLDMEEVWDGTGPDYDRLGQPGFDTKRLSSRRSYIVLPGMQVGEDEYGQVSIV